MLANAIGTGVADDKSIYPYVPEMIRFYLGEQPILSNIPTWQCRKAEDLRYVLSNLELMVVKEVHGAGGYGMLVGPRSTKEEREPSASACWPIRPTISPRTPLRCRPAPPSLMKAVAATYRFTPLRAVRAGDAAGCPGGLTRVALTEGSLVVNSSQGGGTKDTWVMEDDASC
ncbi:Protein containing domains DUF404, DUF407 [Klebsiella pneumoniae IS10]|nr:Protein containing domains DUF404, DUF407 [Klebsiella pneumoniae IS10]